MGADANLHILLDSPVLLCVLKILLHSSICLFILLLFMEARKINERKKHSILFLAHKSRRLMGELIVYQSLRRPSVFSPSICQHFQTSSPLKPLDRLNSNIIWRLTKVCSNGPGHMIEGMDVV